VDSRALLQPVGPLPARVYWTRRAALVGILVVLIIAIAVSCSGGSGSGHPSTPTGTTTPTPSSSPTVTAAACRRDQLAVTASTDAATYPAGVLPRLQVSVRNTGALACVLTESPRTRSWTIVSGTDQVWTTVGCQASSTARPTTLKPGAAVHRSMAWNRHRSGKGCTESSVKADAGTYQLTVSVDGITSTTAVFHLTG
jgi:Protein of unknown function (DUF4232)